MKRNGQRALSPCKYDLTILKPFYLQANLRVGPTSASGQGGQAQELGIQLTLGQPQGQKMLSLQPAGLVAQSAL